MKRSLGLVVVMVAACSSKPGPVVKEGPGTPVPPDPSGYWSGDWGRLVLRMEDGQVRGAYDHDEGTVVGTMNGDTFVGWWCEVPSRTPDHDAGDVELKFVPEEEGGRQVDGRWKYGTEGEWREDWDLGWDEGEPPAELVARFDDPSAFCAHP